MLAFRLPLAVLTLAALLSAPAMAQPAPATSATPPAPAAEDILTRIPGDSMGFVVMTNVGRAGADLNTFIADAGLNTMVPGDMMAMLKMQLMIGEGFNDNGGLALVVLDPAQHGWDIPALIAAGPAAQPPASPQPIALILPGNDPIAIFEAYNPTPGDGHIVIFNGTDMFAKPLGGYTVLAPSVAILEAVIAAPQSAAEVMPAEHRAFVNTCSVAAYGDLKAAGPILSSLVDMAQAEIAKISQDEYADPAEKLIADVYGGFLPFYRDMLGQLEAMTVGIRLVKTGLILDELITYQAESKMGKMLTGWKRQPRPLLDKLPSLPYVLAVGGDSAGRMQGEAEAEALAMTKEFIDNLLASEAIGGKISAEDKARLSEIAMMMCGQVTGMQFYLGGAPADKGVFALAVVLETEDAGAIQAVLPDLTRIKTSLLKALLVDDEPEIADLAITYSKEAVTIGDLAVDTIDITHPEITEQLQYKGGRERIIKSYGDDKLRVYVAPVDAKTLVFTFGGGEAFCAEAIKTAKGGGPLATDPAVAAAMAELPSDPMFAMMLSLPNLLEVVKTGVKTLARPQSQEQILGTLDMIHFQSATPLAIGAAVRGRAIQQSLFIPSTLIRDATQAGMMIFMQMRGGGGGGPQGF